MTTIQIIFSIFIIIIFLLMICLYSELVLRKKQSKAREKENKRKNELIPYFIHQLELAETLNEIFILHIKIWANGIQHPNFGPDKYGMFRTDDILTMNKEEVFLGNIYGLFTHPLTKWECTEDENSKQIVINQYRNHLINNLKMLQNE